MGKSGWCRMVSFSSRTKILIGNTKCSVWGLWHYILIHHSLLQDADQRMCLWLLYSLQSKHANRCHRTYFTAAKTFNIAVALQHTAWNPSLIIKATGQEWWSGQSYHDLPARRSSWQHCREGCVTSKMSWDNVQSTGPVWGRSATLFPSWEAWTLSKTPEQEACID